MRRRMLDFGLGFFSEHAANVSARACRPVRLRRCRRRRRHGAARRHPAKPPAFSDDRVSWRFNAAIFSNWARARRWARADRHGALPRPTSRSSCEYSKRRPTARIGAHARTTTYFASGASTPTSCPWAAVQRSLWCNSVVRPTSGRAASFPRTPPILARHRGHHRGIIEQPADVFLLVKKKSCRFSDRARSNGKILGGDATNDISVTSTGPRPRTSTAATENRCARFELRQPEQLGALDGPADRCGRSQTARSRQPRWTGRFRKIGTLLDAFGAAFPALVLGRGHRRLPCQKEDVVDGFVAGLTEASKFTNAHPSETSISLRASPAKTQRCSRVALRSTTARRLRGRLPSWTSASKPAFSTKPSNPTGLLASSVPLSRNHAPR